MIDENIISAIIEDELELDAGFLNLNGEIYLVLDPFSYEMARTRIAKQILNEIKKGK